MRRLGYSALIVFEIIVLSALILVTHYANYRDVFVGGQVYFTDPDCYARMTRVQLCAAHPGLVIRHQDFENYPSGTTPHTTAPLDYLILGLSKSLEPFTVNPINLAGALISPLFALLGGWFLWWWSRRMNLRYRWMVLLLYALSPILAHGTELGRPDHQSLLILLLTIAICAEWSLETDATRRPDTPQTNPSPRESAIRDSRMVKWAVTSGFAWAVAIWVSAYEPLLLFVLLFAFLLVRRPKAVFSRSRRLGWIVFALIIAIALLTERRLPFVSVDSAQLFRNWSHTIGELRSISLLDPIWFHWAGYFIVLMPVLIGIAIRKRATPPLFLLVLLFVTFALTMWQARWAYFFIVLFALVLPSLLESARARPAVWIAFALSMLPILRDWDNQIWPNESIVAVRTEHRIESAELRELALLMRSSETHAFVAPWWLSPEIAYWSHQPSVAGSSHESLDGIADSARFYLETDWRRAEQILKQHKVDWVFAYDSSRTLVNGGAVLGLPSLPRQPLGLVLDRSPAQAPPFLGFAAQNPAARLFRVVNKR